MPVVSITLPKPHFHYLIALQKSLTARGIAVGADKHEKLRKNRLPPFVPLLNATIDAPAWRAMSHGARSLFIALKRRYDYKNHNNGRLFLSQRRAADELRSHHNEIARWFRELQHYGFIVMVRPGVLGVDGKGKAPRWRLTELGYMTEPPTRDFTRWAGRTFKDTKSKPRAGIGARGVRETRHTSVQENHAVEAKSVQGKAHIPRQERVQEIRHRTRLPYTTAHHPADHPGLEHRTKAGRLRVYLP